MFYFADKTKTIMEEPVVTESHSKAVILVCTFLNSYLRETVFKYCFIFRVKLFTFWLKKCSGCKEKFHGS